ncbi:UNVERIFIED_CONTAM: hypothetical protein K2H54_046768 [Gekko kuhli]
MPEEPHQSGFWAFQSFLATQKPRRATQVPHLHLDLFLELLPLLTSRQRYWALSMDCVQAMKPPGARRSQSAYTDLLSVIEEMSNEIQPAYVGSKSAIERMNGTVLVNNYTGMCRLGS